MKRLISYAAAILLTLGLALLLYQFRNILILLLLAILVSASIRPVVLLLIQRFNVPRPAATIATYLIGSLFILLLLFITGRNLLNESQAVLNKLAATYESRFPNWVEGSTIQRALASELPPPDEFYESLIGPVFGQQIMGFASGLLGLFGGTAVVLVLSIYWTIDQTRLERYWLSLLPAAWRVEARRIWREMELGIGAYFRSEVIQSFFAVILLTLIYTLIGIDYPFILAGLAAIAWLIPLVGAFFAVLPILAVGLLNASFGLSILAALVTIAFLSGLELIVEPRLFNRRQYNSTTTVLLMLIFVDDFGLVGLIMAPPIAAALQIFFNHWVRSNTVVVPQEPDTRISQLQKRFDTTMEKLVQNKDDINPAVDNLATRLKELLKEANQLTAENKRS